MTWQEGSARAIGFRDSGTHHVCESQYRRCRFPDREIPDKNEVVDSLTIGVRGIGLHVNCAHGTRKIANSDFPILEGGQKGVVWVVRTPERSWKSSLTLRA